MNTSSTGWFYLDANGQHQGPLDVQTVKGLVDMGSVLQQTLFWAEGRPDWEPLANIPELSSLVEPAAKRSAATPGVAVQSAAAAAQQMAAATNVRGVVVAAPATKTAEPDPLAAFEAEISALEAATAEEDPERATTPPPDEREFEDDDGTVYVWDPAVRKFVPKSKDGQARPGGAPAAASKVPSYTAEDMTFEAAEETIPQYEPPVAEEDAEDDGEGDLHSNIQAAVARRNAAKAAAAGQPTPDADAADTGANGNGRKGSAQSRKRAAEEVIEREREKQKRAKEAAERKAEWVQLKVNTSVYVTGLPADVTEAELAQEFSKCGVIKPDDDGRPRVKVYRDAEGQPKGDGLVTYLKEPSVALACQILDGGHFSEVLQTTNHAKMMRRADSSQAMMVTPAKFEQKGKDFDATKVQKKKKPPKKVGKLKAAVLDEKLLGWSGFDDQVPANKVTVILKHMFSPDDFEQDPQLKEDIDADIKSECSKLGKVERVKVYYHNPEGVASVRFATEEAAQQCIAVMHGRFFGGRQLDAGLWDGFTNYYVKPPKESAEEQQARLERFARELEEREAAERRAADANAAQDVAALGRQQAVTDAAALAG